MAVDGGRAGAAPTHESALNTFLWKAGVVVGGGGLVFGYDIGVISGTLPALKDEFGLQPFEVGVVVSILYAGSILGCIVGGPMCDHWGRWRTIQMQNAVFVLGAILTAVARNYAMLVVGRLLVGFASALSGLADVPYLTEIAPAEYRGVLSGQYEILVAAGILISFCLALAFATVPDGWRWALLIPGGMAALQSWGMVLLPESPKWLLGKGRREEARQALRCVYGAELMDAAEVEASRRPVPSYCGADMARGDFPEDVQAFVEACRQFSPGSPSSSPSCSLPLSRGSLSAGILLPPLASQLDSPIHAESGRREGGNGMCAAMQGDAEQRQTMREYHRAVTVALALQAWSQLSGANVVRNFAPTIFEESGASSTLALSFNIGLGAVKFFWTTWAVLYIEQQGRLALLTVGICAVLLGMALLACATASLSLFICGCVLVYSGFGLGYGPIPWVVSAEVAPTAVRARVVAYSLLASNAAQLVTNLAFLPMVQSLTAPGCFAAFAMINVLALTYTRLFVVETRSLSPPDILQKLKDRHEASLALLALGPRRGVGWVAVDQREGAAEGDNPLHRLPQAASAR